MASFTMDVEDISYEEDLLRNAYSVKVWWRYITAVQARAQHLRSRIKATEGSKGGKQSSEEAAAAAALDGKVSTLYERALKLIPGSYKLWHGYLGHRRRYMTHPSIRPYFFS